MCTIKSTQNVRTCYFYVHMISYVHPRGGNMWIDEWLFHNKMKIKDFAEKVGVSREYIHAVIRGKRRGGPDFAKKIAELTNNQVTTDEILYREMEEGKIAKKYK